MSLFNFGAAEDTSVGNFDFADDDQVDPGIRKMFEDPDFSFSQDFPEAPSDPFTNSFPVGQPASDIVADNFPVSGSAPVAAAAPTPPRPAADYAPRRPAPSPHTARPGHSPHSGRPAQDVSHQQHHAADRSHQTAQRKVAAPAQRAADPDRRKLAGSGSREPAARLTVTSDPPARSANTTPAKSAAGAQAARALGGQAVRESADKLLQNLFQQRVDRERAIAQLTAEKQQLQVRVQELSSQFESCDSEKQRLKFQLKEKDAELAEQRKACDELKLCQENLRVRVENVEKDCRQFEECKLLFEKSSAANEKTLQKQAEQYNNHMNLVAGDMVQLKQVIADLKSQLTDSNEQVAQNVRNRERAEQECGKLVDDMREKCDAELSRVAAEFAEKEANLKADNFELQQQVIGMTEERQELVAANEDLEAVRTQLDDCQQELGELQQQFQQVTADRDAADQKCQRLERELTDQQTSYVALNEELLQLQEEYDQTRLNYEDRIHTIRQDLQAECRKREDEIAELQSESQRLMTQIQVLETEKTAAVTRSSELAAEKVATDQKRVQLQNEVSELNGLLASSKSRFDAALESAEQDKLSAEQKVAARDTELAACANQLKENAEELVRLSRELDEEKEKRAAIEKELSDRASVLTELEQVKEQLNQAQKLQTQMQNQRQVSEQELASLRRRLSDKDAVIEQKSDELEAMRGKLSERDQELAKAAKSTPVLPHSPPKRKSGRRALAFEEDEDTDEADFVKRQKRSPVKKQAEKKPAAKKPAERKKPPPKKQEKKQEDVYRSFADASAGDCTRRKLPMATTSRDNNADESDGGEWY